MSSTKLPAENTEICSISSRYQKPILGYSMNKGGMPEYMVDILQKLGKESTEMQSRKRFEGLHRLKVGNVTLDKFNLSPSDDPSLT